MDVNRFKKGHLEFDPSADNEFYSTQFEAVRDPYEFEGMMLILERQLERAVMDWEMERRRSMIPEE